MLGTGKCVEDFDALQQVLVPDSMPDEGVPRRPRDPRQDLPLPPACLDPLIDRHPPIVPAAFRKLDAVAVPTARLLPAPRIRWLPFLAPLPTVQDHGEPGPRVS